MIQSREGGGEELSHQTFSRHREKKKSELQHRYFPVLHCFALKLATLHKVLYLLYLTYKLCKTEAISGPNETSKGDIVSTTVKLAIVSKFTVKESRFSFPLLTFPRLPGSMPSPQLGENCRSEIRLGPSRVPKRHPV